MTSQARRLLFLCQASYPFTLLLILRYQGWVWHESYSFKGCRKNTIDLGIDHQRVQAVHPFQNLPVSQIPSVHLTPLPFGSFEPSSSSRFLRFGTLFELLESGLGITYPSSVSVLLS